MRYVIAILSSVLACEEQEVAASSSTFRGVTRLCRVPPMRSAGANFSLGVGRRCHPGVGKVEQIWDAEHDLAAVPNRAHFGGALLVEAATAVRGVNYSTRKRRVTNHTETTAPHEANAGTEN